MCTCINLKTKDYYFGHNLDLEYRFYEKVVITPRNYEFKLKVEKSFKTKYAMVGMATVVDNYLSFKEDIIQLDISSFFVMFVMEEDDKYYSSSKKCSSAQTNSKEVNPATIILMNDITIKKLTN